ncbi:MAG: hypothetical protein KTR30_23290 [Saprospiraceae bacterium]|nr:hypothetical protein [Saprospiraceae bacterium]
MSLIEPKQLGALQEHWRELAEQVGLSKDVIQESWIEISNAYRSPDRFYHNLVHISDMLTLFKLHQSHLEYPEVVALSIWFHDIIYQVDRKDNEKRSAERATFYLQHSPLIEAKVELVYQSILATQHHQLSINYPDLAYLLDFDLAVLGRNWDRYQLYASQIRKEYSIYPDKLYRPGRKKVLQHFLEREILYFTAIGQQEWESQARSNLRMELSSL